MSNQKLPTEMSLPFGAEGTETLRTQTKISRRAMDGFLKECAEVRKRPGQLLAWILEERYK